MRTEELRLDGNAAGGPLRDVFARDVTGAVATCAGCRRSGAVGAVLLYAHGMGLVGRCPSCDGVLLRLVRTPGQLRLDLSGVALLVIPDADATNGPAPGAPVS